MIQQKKTMVMSDEKLFYPNELKPADIESLKDWQLLMGAAHFAPTMGDCVVYNYGYWFGYRYHKGTPGGHGHGVWMDDNGDMLSLSADIDVSKPFDIMRRYFTLDVEQERWDVKYLARIVPVDWKAFCIEFLKVKAKEREVIDV